MMTDISRRGVYYNLELSPYEYVTIKGKVLKFSSQKKLDMYIARVGDYRERFEKLLEKYSDILGAEWTRSSIELWEQLSYIKIYDEIEG